jgi:membrane protein required for colicin V production
MTSFDILVLGVLCISGLMGFLRGATRELVSVLSFFAAITAALYGVRLLGDMGRDLIDPDWAGTAAAGAISFVIAFLLVNGIGSAVVASIYEVQILGILDRSIGLGFGLMRALVILGSFNIAFNMVTPANLRPAWLDQSKLYPLTTAAAKALQTFAPKGLDMAGKLQPSLERAIGDISANPQRDSAPHQGYDPRDRGGLDDLVEKSR